MATIFDLESSARARAHRPLGHHVSREISLWAFLVLKLVQVTYLSSVFTVQAIRSLLSKDRKRRTFRCFPHHFHCFDRRVPKWQSYNLILVWHSLKSRTSSKRTEFSTFDRGSCCSFFPSNAKQRSLMSRNTRIACKYIEAAFKLEKYVDYEDMTYLSTWELRVRTKHKYNFHLISIKQSTPLQCHKPNMGKSFPQGIDIKPLLAPHRFDNSHDWRH